MAVKLTSKNCSRCGTYLAAAFFYESRSKFFIGGSLPICKSCLSTLMAKSDWTAMDKFCQWADYPFYPEIWVRLQAELGEKALDAYVKGYLNGDAEYAAIDWKHCQEEWKELLSSGNYKDKFPEMSAQKRTELEAHWGTKTYTDAELEYLEKFYQDLCTTYNVITATQKNSAEIIAKLSVRISQKIKNDLDIDKDISAYDKQMKIGGFTSDNIQSLSDFESVGELAAYLEKIGWVNNYYDGAPKDVVDTTMLNMQAFVKRLINGEPNIKDVVDRRLAAMHMNETGEFVMSDEEFDSYDIDGTDFVEVTGDADDEGEMEVDL